MLLLPSSLLDKPRFFFCFGFDGQHRTVRAPPQHGTVLQNDGTNHLGFDAMSINERQMALTTSGLCALQLAESIKSGTGFEPWVFYYP